MHGINQRVDFVEVEKSSAELSVLVNELDDFQKGLYPEESNHCIELASLKDEQIRCLIVRDAEGFPAGCGAVLLNGDGSGELKRLYIRPAFRGNRLGEQIVNSLEKFAAGSGVVLLRLETGIHQKPAIALYHRCGYKQCAAFIPYIEDPLSVFMQKHLL